MNRKQLITLWLLGLWCVFSIIITIKPSRYHVSELILMVVPAIIIGFLFFISFNKGLLQKESSDLHKVIHKTTRLKAFPIGLIGFIIGSLFVGFLSVRVLDKKNEQISRLEIQVKEQESKQKEINIINKASNSADIGKMEWNEVKVLNCSGHSVDLQKANNEVIEIAVRIKSFINEVKKGDTVWLNTYTRQVKLSSGKIYPISRINNIVYAY